MAACGHASVKTRNDTMNDSPQSFRKTCRRYDVPGQAHCLTFSCFRRQPFLKGPQACRWLAETIERVGWVPRTHAAVDGRGRESGHPLWSLHRRRAMCIILP